MANETITRAAGALGITVADFNQLPEKVREGALAMVKTNETLTNAMSGGDFSLKVGEKGGMVIRGFGAYPHTFYADQWTRFAGWLKSEGGFELIEKFTKEHAAELKTKAAAVVANKSAAAS